ncbi:MAG: 30S ribosomal protein S16 [Elusimicrobia bacterium]|nr:30S ribosomal protein S16 [Elusimicrobiota bacterium]
MAVRLRLQRIGKPQHPHYRVVAIDQRDRVGGAALEVVGYYTPRTSPAPLQFNEARVQYWYARGAEPSQTVHRLLQRAGIWQRLSRVSPP